MRRFILAAILAASMPTFAAAGAASDMRRCGPDRSGEELIEACTRLVENRRYIRRKNDRSIWYNNLAVGYFQIDDTETAVAKLDEALRLNPRNRLARRNRARYRAELGRYDEAIEDADAVIERSRSAANYAFRAEIFRRADRPEQAIADFNKAIALQPRNARHHHNLGELNAQLSRHEAALESFSRAIELNSRNPSSYHARGLTWSNAGKCDQAIADYTKAIELSPRFSSAFNNRGVCYMRAGEQEKAAADFEQALKLQPHNALYRRNLSTIRGMPSMPRAPSVPPPAFKSIPDIRDLLNQPEFKDYNVKRGL